MPVFCVVFELGPFGKRDYAGISRGLELVGPACEVSHGTWLVKAETQSEVWAVIDPMATAVSKFAPFSTACARGWGGAASCSTKVESALGPRACDSDMVCSPR